VADRRGGARATLARASSVGLCSGQHLRAGLPRTKALLHCFMTLGAAARRTALWEVDVVLMVLVENGVEALTR